MRNCDRILGLIKALLLFLFATPLLASNDPSPLGLTLGKATISDLKNKYSAVKKGINAYSNGEMYEIDTSKTDVEGLNSATAIFDERGLLVAVIMKFPKGKFGEHYYYWDKVFKSLRGKYKLVKSRVPFVGDRYAEFISGNSIIILDAPHLSFTMTLIYAKKDFWNKVLQTEQKEQQRKRKTMEQNL
ncbi:MULTISPECIES: hypothetical protein [Thermodesulfobacterium]|uniref:Uncharacterized protein n=1 Tax=Thermodesulfobacterium commune TaxID=1741 RepID=A0A3B8N5X4_9BACT|nr:hypothetical protein [Thermodesulfobacterium sp.]HAA83658.1 hypothetical protein [Thermodesulfobacterium commune]MDN5380507.1 hypothetical protein [Thermodesulfobacterium sp.]HBT03758.1 hypothetical protein [Thermodesulfobacterium commune]HCE79470.1 hypothetical protein [Thermodesulfobacterium commune]HCP09949.1 hypothetical protein [Thermodesulfobacterium commune]